MSATPARPEGQGPIALLLQKAAGGDPLLADFGSTVGAQVARQLATRPALGGAGRISDLPGLPPPEGLRRYSDQELKRFGSNPDQSLAAHLLNGLFLGLRLGRSLVAQRALTEAELRIWPLGYVCHDFNKVFQGESGRIDVAREAVRRIGAAFEFEAFLPGWLDSLDDVLFLVLNTERVQSANLNLRDFRLGVVTDHRRRETLRLLCTAADLLVHMKEPSEVSPPHRLGASLHDVLQTLFGVEQAPHLVYHRVAPVHGLLTNLIHNAVGEELSTQGCEPFLFFPSGVVYLAPAGHQAVVDRGLVAQNVWGRLVDQVGDSDRFYVRGPTGYRVATALTELLGPEEMLAMGRRAVARIRPAQNYAKERLYGYFTGQSGNDLRRRYPIDDDRKRVVDDAVQEGGLPTDIRVDQLAEYLIVLVRHLEGALGRKAEATDVLLGALGLSATELREDARQEKGGTRYGWWYVAARYIQAHPGLDDLQLDDVLEQLSDAVFGALRVSEHRPVRTRASLADRLSSFILEALDVDGQSGPSAFGEELQRYLEAKERDKPVCTLCSTRYEAVEEQQAETPFANQAYSNTGRLDSRRVVRGICPICRIETILRMTWQIGAGEGAVQLFLYPTYFFTSETERLARFFIDRLKDLNIDALRRYLQGRSFAPGAIAGFDGLLFAPDEVPQTFRVRKPPYSDRDRAGMVFFSLLPPRPPRGQQLTETDAWAIPALLALASPLLLNVKVVATQSFVPLFGSAADFPETVLLDGAHSFVVRALGADRFRLDEIPTALGKLLNLYDLHLDVFGETRNQHWPMLNAVVRDVVPDPYAVFAYYDRKKRKADAQDQQPDGGMPPWDIDRYVRIYRVMGGDEGMGLVGNLVDAYAKFYRASGYAVYTQVRPFSVAVDAALGTLPQTDEETLKLAVAGQLEELMNRVRNGQAEGFDPIMTDVSLGDAATRYRVSQQAIGTFAEQFVRELFLGYCRGERAVLREQSNLLRSAAHFAYLARYGRRSLPK